MVGDIFVVYLIQISQKGEFVSMGMIVKWFSSIVFKRQLMIQLHCLVGDADMYGVISKCGILRSTTIKTQYIFHQFCKLWPNLSTLKYRWLILQFPNILVLELHLYCFMKFVTHKILLSHFRWVGGSNTKSCWVRIQ